MTRACLMTILKMSEMSLFLTSLDNQTLCLTLETRYSDLAPNLKSKANLTWMTTNRRKNSECPKNWKRIGVSWGEKQQKTKICESSCRKESELLSKIEQRLTHITPMRSWLNLPRNPANMSTKTAFKLCKRSSRVWQSSTKKKKSCLKIEYNLLRKKETNWD